VLRDNDWSILKQTMQTTVADRSSAAGNFAALEQARATLRNEANERAMDRAINAVSLGRSIVLHGAMQAFNDFPGVFPFARIGDLLAVDRREVQGLRAIRDLLAEYVRHAERKTPISVAVFGPPGSGKSFGVRQIASEIARDRQREFVFNLAQFNSFAELTRQLLKVRDSALNDEIPLVFFDEFDCSLSESPLGWLKYFLSPMQDGTFQHEESMLSIGKAIFVFAGGIASSHAEFSDARFWNDRNSGISVSDVFKTAKGLDFHSRLRGFLDILGPNPDLTCSDNQSNSDPVDRFVNEDFTFVIRRAILIRNIIERIHKESTVQLLDSEGSLEIDRDVLDALLLTDTYRHGVRSIEALFEMSSIQGNGALSKTALPSKLQYEMHVHNTFSQILVRDYERLGSEILRGMFEYLSNISHKTA